MRWDEEFLRRNPHITARHMRLYEARMSGRTYSSIAKEDGTSTANITVMLSALRKRLAYYEKTKLQDIEYTINDLLRHPKGYRFLKFYDDFYIIRKPE